MGLLFLTAIPVLGLVFVLVFAFAGENESRKNLFRALIAWFSICVGLAVVLFLLANGKVIHFNFDIPLTHRTQ